MIDAADVLRLPLAWTELTALVHGVEHGVPKVPNGAKGDGFEGKLSKRHSRLTFFFWQGYNCADP
jgi:hypothetical protein